MASSITEAINRRQAERVSVEELDQLHEMLAWQAAQVERNLQYAKQSFRRECLDIHTRMERLIDKVEQALPFLDLNLNANGELQSEPRDLHRKTVEICRYEEQRSDLYRMPGCAFPIDTEKSASHLLKKLWYETLKEYVDAD